MERRKQRILSMVQNARLVNLIEAEFAASKMTDEGFAEYASKKIGAEATKQHVANRRVELGIPSLREVKGATTDDLHEMGERVLACETQLAADQKEFCGLSTMVIELEKRLNLLEKAARLEGTFELPLEPLRAAK